MKKLIVLLFIVGLWSCKSKNQEEVIVDDLSDLISTKLPEDFEEFYVYFHNDTSFQKAHIVFPLVGEVAMRDEFTLAKDTLWQDKGWVIHKPFNNMGGTFNISFTNFKGIVTEEIIDNSGQYSMIRRFSKIGGEWNLIFYREMGPW
jgi:hypothetical protein